jgi:putative drug exporter of the RND superfamily
VLVLAVCIPIAPMVLDAVDYTMSTGGTENLPSVEAQAYINQNFGGSTTSSSGSIILINAEPGHIFDDEIKSTIMDLTNQLKQASIDGVFDADITVTTIYTALYDYTVVYIEVMAPLYALGSNLSIAIPNYLFQVPLSYWDSFNNTQDALLMEYGIPELYYGNWLMENESGGTITEIDSRAYEDTSEDIQTRISERPSLNATEVASLWLYFEYFSGSWNSTSSAPIYSQHPSARLHKAMMDGYVGFIVDPFIMAQGDLFRLYLTVVHESFDLSNYQEFHRISRFNDLIYRGILDRILSLLPDEINEDCILYYETFYSQWNSSDSVPTVTEFHAYADYAANAVIDAADEMAADLVQIYYFELGWENRDDQAAINQLTVDYLATGTETDPWLVQTIIDMGARPTSSEVSTLASEIVANSTVADYPIVVLPLIPIVLVGGENESTLMMVSFSQDGKTVSGVQYVQTIRDMTHDAFSGLNQVTCYVTGVDPMTYDAEVAMEEDLAIIDPVAIILILVLVGLYFRSLLAAGLPPAAIGIALGISFAILFFVAAYLFSVNYLVITLMITATLGAGCDYCIFILSRYREERRNGKSKEEAVEEAVTWAGETVTTSAATVMIGFGALFFASLEIVMSFGTLVIGIIIALLVALTLIPSLLSIFGDKVFWPSKHTPKPSKIGTRYFSHAAEFSIKHAKVLLVVAILISVPAIYLVMTTPTSYDFIETLPDCESKQGIESMEDTFGAGMISPTMVALDMSGSVYIEGRQFNITMLDAIENMCQDLESVPGVQQMFSPTRPYGVPIDYANISEQHTVEAAESLAVMHAMVGKGNDSVLINIVFLENPYSDQAMGNIEEIRGIASDISQEEPEIDVAYVGGGTAMMYDFASAMTDDFLLIIGVAIVLIYIVLMIVLGSVLNPLRSILTILLSIFWTLAITSLVFQWSMDMYLNFEVPLILMVVCLGLGMDYDILLSTRIREEVHKGMSTNDAIKHSMLQTGGIITTCGVVMASAFGSLIITGNPMLMQFGVALMVAILLDATVVRTYLVPAIMSLLGKWNWWAPRWIQRKGEGKKL